ncbi:glycosyltransferase family protein [Acinetobacter indicus]|uniref:hypothetical protein n=1 Tax=Acinetobacter indicus TaxID=756892 RepID=UPI000CEC3259|nr:hypothetical protein [Acinetobacter indicus]
MKILIIAFDVAPLDLISSQRVNYFISYFHGQGYEVDVLTSKKRFIDGPINDVVSYNELIKKANFIEIPSTISKQDIDIVSDHSVNEYRTSNLRSILKKFKAYLTRFTGQMLDYRTIWAFNSIKYIQNSELYYDVILTSSLPACVNWVGWHIKKKNNKVLWIADFRDLWTLNHLVEYSFFSKKIDSFLEKKFISKADLITTVSQDLAAKMEGFHKKDVLVVRNGFVPEEYKSINANYDIFHNKNKINIVYAGNIYRGRRDPTPLFKTIQEHKLEQSVNIHFFGYYLENLKEIINDNDANSYCFFYKPLPRNEMFSILKASDFNLFLESGEDDAKGVMPGKIFELIALGRPIITIGPQDNFESVQLIKSSGLFVGIQKFVEILKMDNPYSFNLKDQTFLENIAGREAQAKKIHQYIGEKMGI